MLTVLGEGTGKTPVLRQAWSYAASDGRSAPQPAPATRPSTCKRLLAGMIEAGLVQEAICAFLTLTLESLSRQIVCFGLPMPSDRPMRKPGGRHPWTVDEVRLLISLWCANLPGTAIARVLNRSAGGVYSKARRLGLYRRDRRALIKAADYFGATCESAGADSPDAVPAAIGDVESAAEAAPHEVIAKATPQEVIAKAKPTVSRIAWNDDLTREVKKRWVAWQHHKGIAKDLGMTEGAVRSRANAVGLPRRPGKLVPDYIEGRPYDTSLEDSLVERYCDQGHTIFWGNRNGPRTSPKIMKTKGYKKARSGPEEYSIHI